MNSEESTEDGDTQTIPGAFAVVSPFPIAGTMDRRGNNDFDDAPTSSNTESPQIEVPLEAIPVDEEEEARKLTQMEERLSEVIAARLSSPSPETRIKKKFSLAIAFIVMVGASIGVAVHFLSQSEPVQSMDQSTDADAATDGEVFLPEDEFKFNFDPPTLEDCQAILNGTQVEGQDSMFRRKVRGILDVSTFDELPDQLVLVEYILYTANAILVPLVIGCIDFEDIAGFAQADNNTDPPTSASPSPDRYIVGNAGMSNATFSNDPCNKEAPQPCYRIIVDFELWLQDDVSLIVLLVTGDEALGFQLDTIVERGAVILKSTLINLEEEK